MNTISQEFAQVAFDQVSGIDKNDKTYCQKYGSMAHKLPILIRASGLAQALAFVQAKKQGAYNDLLDHLAEAVKWPGAITGEQLAAKSRSEHLDGYILLTRRVSAALIWYKRFAESILDVKPTDDAPEGEGGL